MKRLHPELDLPAPLWSCGNCLKAHAETPEILKRDGTDNQVRCECGGELCGCADCERIALATRSGETPEQREALARAAGLGFLLRAEPPKPRPAAVRLLPVPPNRLHEPRGGWQHALEGLVLEARCPWCGHPLQNLAIGPVGEFPRSLTWACFEGCNP